MTAFARLLALSCLALAQERTPVPDDARLKKAETEVRDVFKADYAKQTPADRRSLALKLFRNGLDTQDDAATRYVLLREASVQAAQAGELAIGLRALDELALGFQVDPVAVKQSFLAEVAKGARTPEDFKPLTEAYLSLMRQALAADAFDVAEQSGAAAVGAARRAKDVALASRAEAKSKEVAGARATAEATKKHRDTLAKNPDDPAANAAVGRYECLFRGNWTAGLSLLAKGSDAPLRELAAKDLANPEAGEPAMAVGDGWWTLAEKETGESKANARRRAAFWYAKARDQLSGLIKQRVELRIAQVEGGSAPPSKPTSKDPTLVGHWTFDEGSGTTSAGIGGSFSFSGKVSWAPGVAESALKFDGASAYATVADAPALHMETESFTVACSIRPNGTAIYRIVNKWDHGPMRGWLLDINGQAGEPDRPGHLRARLSDGPVNVNVTVDAQVATNAWTAIAMVVDRTAKEVRLYAGGNQVGNAGLGALGSLGNGASLAIGWIPGTPGGLFYDGTIDDLRLYRRALTPAQIKELVGKR